MKRTLLTIFVGALTLVVAASSFAQGGPPRAGGPGGPNRADFAKRQAEFQKKVFGQLKLNATQKKKIAALNKKRDAKMQAMFKSMQAGGPPKPGERPKGMEGMREKMQKARKDYETGLSKILTAAQYKKYQEIVKAERAKMRGPGGPGGPGGGRRGGGA